MKALPCPFCGSKARVSYVPKTEAMPEIENAYFQVSCRDMYKRCPAHPMCFGDSKKEAVAKWNRRGALPIGESDYRDKARRTFQPVVVREDGCVCFKENKIVEFLLRNGGFDMNALQRMDFSDLDRTQFAQLIGYTVCGFGELNYVPLAVAHVADEIGDLVAAANDLGGAE